MRIILTILWTVLLLLGSVPAHTLVQISHKRGRVDLVRFG